MKLNKKITINKLQFIIEPDSDYSTKMINFNVNISLDKKKFFSEDTENINRKIRKMFYSLSEKTKSIKSDYFCLNSDWIFIINLPVIDDNLILRKTNNIFIPIEICVYVKKLDFDMIQVESLVKLWSEDDLFKFFYKLMKNS